MKKIDLGQTIAILANLGVIAGIMFLAIEVQQIRGSRATLALFFASVNSYATEWNYKFGRGSR